VQLAEAIAGVAGVHVDAVLAFFSWQGRIPLETQNRVARAADAVLGLARNRRTMRLENALMQLADETFDARAAQSAAA